MCLLELAIGKMMMMDDTHSRVLCGQLIVNVKCLQVLFVLLSTMTQNAINYFKCIDVKQRIMIK